jgi:hypothetical protein
MSRRVLVKRTELRCAICSKSEDVRARFDGYLEAYLNGGTDEGGRKLTWPILEELSGVLTGKRLDKRSLRRHLDGHSIVVDESCAGELKDQASKGDEERDALLAEVDSLLEGGQPISPSGVLNVQLRAWLLDTRRRIASGERIQLSADQAQRAASAMFSNSKRAEEASLLAALTGGIGQVFTRAFADRDQAELEAGEVLVGEVVAEEDEAA